MFRLEHPCGQPAETRKTKASHDPRMVTSRSWKVQRGGGIHRRTPTPLPQHFSQRIWIEVQCVLRNLRKRMQLSSDCLNPSNATPPGLLLKRIWGARAVVYNGPPLRPQIPAPRVVSNHGSLISPPKCRLRVEDILLLSVKS